MKNDKDASWDFTFIQGDVLRTDNQAQISRISCTYYVFNKIR